VRKVDVKDWESAFVTEWACDNPECEYCVRTGMKLVREGKSWKVGETQYQYTKPCRLCGDVVKRYVGKYNIREKKIETRFMVKHKARIRGFLKKERAHGDL
jgi:hypothetical protein